jgi:hypothetical protein
MNRPAILCLAAVAAAFSSNADTLKLRSGKAVEGTILASNAREIEFLGTDGRKNTYPIGDVERVSFSTVAASATAAAPAKAAKGVTLPSGTPISVRLIDAVDVDSAGAGHQFRATLDDPVMLSGSVIIPRGANATLQAVQVKQSGRFKGSDEITLKLNRITVNGKVVDVVSSLAESKSKGEGKQTSKKVLGGAGLGAIIGGIAGGGTGAAIGAVVGVAGGTAVAATGQQHLKLPPETRLQFQLASAVTIR